MDKSAVIHIQKEDDIILARKTSREFAKLLNFSATNQSRVLTAVSELARNIYRYAGNGEIKVEAIKEMNKSGLIIVAEDEGPGIIDISNAMTQGYSTSGSLGAGLPGLKRMMDEFQILSEEGSGTKVTVIKWQMN
ncbi:anti-sigma regulatory factor [Jeotgalibacillus salarius]|uniref:Anti-sigma regulatory factor n=1 Tax=Jeotgalibacillus salarius TaxID=546023 RepID=A0A4Y8LHL8_9BACL|nr:anti-sigma regulatory factor [Jeotgalibacillus salarius]TFE02326.1 anti-sigma regulatory factor [Jeotgalibacillus salarius]